MDTIQVVAISLFGSTIGAAIAANLTRKIHRAESLEFQRQCFAAFDVVLVASRRLKDIAVHIDRFLIMWPTMSDEAIASAVIEHTKEISVGERSLVTPSAVARARSLMGAALRERGMSDLVNALAQQGGVGSFSSQKFAMSASIGLDVAALELALRLQPARSFELSSIERLAVAIGWPGKDNLILQFEQQALQRFMGPVDEAELEKATSALIERALADVEARPKSTVV